MVLYSAVSSPLDRSKRFTFSSPGRPVHSDTVLGFSWKHSSHAAIAQRLFNHISTTVYSQVLIYTAESTEASWSERKCPNFETVTTGIRTRALSIASPAFYQLSYRAPHITIIRTRWIFDLMIISWSFQNSVFGNAQTRAHDQTSFCLYLAYYYLYYYYYY